MAGVKQRTFSAVSVNIRETVKPAAPQKTQRPCETTPETQTRIPAVTKTDADSKPTFPPRTVKRFRHLWNKLHLAAAAFARGCISAASFKQICESVHAELQTVCKRCAEHFQTEHLNDLRTSDPHNAEELVYSVRASISFDNKSHYVPPKKEEVLANYQSQLRAVVHSSLISLSN